MAKYRKILVAYDGSASARNALAEAAKLADRDKSWIKVLAVIPPYEGDLELIGVSDIKATIEGAGSKLIAEAKEIAEGAGVHVLADLSQGEPYERIVHVAEDENCDLIIMGRRGRTHVERELVGGVTARVIGHTDRDVLVIPKTAHIGWDTVLVATDGSDYSRAAEDKAVEIAKERGSKLLVLSVVYTNDEFYALASKAVEELMHKAHDLVDTVCERAQAQGISCEPQVVGGEPFQAICDTAAEKQASLIVMGTHGRKGLTRLLMGSVTEHVIGLANCPVMVSHLKR